jgi:hypothetical protein
MYIVCIPAFLMQFILSAESAIAKETLWNSVTGMKTYTQMILTGCSSDI